MVFADTPAVDVLRPFSTTQTLDTSALDTTFKTVLEIKNTWIIKIKDRGGDLNSLAKTYKAFRTKSLLSLF